jgi:phenylalanyl-tRNA synthetase beta chain
MKISLEWLRDWVDPGADVPALAHALTMAGLEIEGIERAAPSFSGVVVGEVIGITKHPDAEKLSVCQVSAGAEELQIVCGAPNVRAGMKAPLATVGAKLPDGLEIKQAKLRGVESFGMLCSAKELKIADDSSGLMELPTELRTGQDVREALVLDDYIFEVNLTPNRGDCMSVLGVAREVAAARQTKLHAAECNAVAATVQDKWPVSIESEGCRTFVGRVIRGVRGNARSPLWLRERLRRAGLRPVSAIVDATNYVMLELGQPMHAYDLGRLHGGIFVRQAKPQENLILLDGRSIELTPDVMVIADENVVLGMAGVMGGQDSGISDETKDVFLEVAFFEPNAVAGRGRRYGLVTDASQRFERGVDPELQERAAERATQLILEVAGGSAGPLVVTRGASREKLPSIRLRETRVQRLLGVHVPASRIEELLQRLGMKLTREGDGWNVTPPSWRFDIAIEADLIEEVARLYGYDNIPEAPEVAASAIAPATETRVRPDRLAKVLIDRGYQEAITYSFVEPRIQQTLFSGVSGLALANPISAELAVMRVSLWPGLVQVVQSNVRRQQHRVRLFEIGRTFDAKTGAETDVIAGVVTGNRVAEQWGESSRASDFFDVKADVEGLLRLTGREREFRFAAEVHPALHPGQSAHIYSGTRAIGWIGALNPAVRRQIDLTYEVFAFELELENTFAARIPEYAEISKYPAIRRDLAMIVDESASFEAIKQVAAESAGELLRDLLIFDLYRGTEIEKGKKSIALGFNLQDTSRTLTDMDADQIMARVAADLRRQFNATIRDK